VKTKSEGRGNKPHTCAGAQVARRVVWIFGAGRSGTTWLASMLAELPGGAMWDEPLIGALFGDFYRAHNGDNRRENFILGPPLKETWLPSIREMVIRGAEVRFGHMARHGKVIIKEPHGCAGAMLISQALPESTFLLMLRDPRDVLSSMLDANQPGTWVERTRGRGGRQFKGPSEALDRSELLQRKTHQYVRDVDWALEGYRAHSGPRSIVRYEDLRRDPSGELRRLARILSVPLREQEASRIAEAHAWESIPDSSKGSGSFYRKGTVGGWRADLSRAEARVIETRAKHVLQRFYA
jgi:Sulfotransferase domain